MHERHVRLDVGARLFWRLEMAPSVSPETYPNSNLRPVDLLDRSSILCSPSILLDSSSSR
ncbi:hypothetical protein DY000_02049429 [Brassica cretica]|uniref:Uncharacterized protein n=1 Tax=Brassica cretica TaxID=69181 RepID=A0ABQ7F0E2_BRACR|nr:hypothetical protein DY000_02049429 [Brassica cretica]